MFGWNRRKPQTVPAVSSDRYAGKPLLILLENYVLDVIGCLSPEKQASVRQVVERSYGPGVDWKATLRKTLHMEASLDGHLSELWSKNQQMASNAGQTLTPEEFARIVVDTNFRQLID